MSESDHATGAGSTSAPLLKHRSVTIRGITGYVLKARESGAYCFVPGQCVHATAAGGVVVDEIAYLAGGWGTRNSLRAEAEVNGRFLFPDADAGILDPTALEVVSFLGRFA